MTKLVYHILHLPVTSAITVPGHLSPCLPQPLPFPVPTSSSAASSFASVLLSLLALLCYMSTLLVYFTWECELGPMAHNKKKSRQHGLCSGWFKKVHIHMLVKWYHKSFI